MGRTSARDGPSQQGPPRAKRTMSSGRRSRVLTVDGYGIEVLWYYSASEGDFNSTVPGLERRKRIFKSRVVDD